MQTLQVLQILQVLLELKYQMSYSFHFLISQLGISSWES